MFASLASLPVAAQNWDGLMRFIRRIGEVLLTLAPGAIILSFAVSGLMWIMAGSRARMAERAKDQFKATAVVTVVLGSYWLIRGLVTGLSFGDFGS